METQETTDARIGNRAERRTSLFVMASMSARTVSGPVKIRNLSTHGGLIEASQLPEVSETLQLRRGDLCASGQVVWRSGRKAGLRLDQAIAVSDWLPSGHSDQAIVDESFQRIKAGEADPAPHQARASSLMPYDREQLHQNARALDQLADLLAENAEIVARFGPKLQVLDTTSQIMRRMAEACPLPG